MNTADQNINNFQDNCQCSQGCNFGLNFKTVILTALIALVGGFVYKWVSSPMIITVTGSGEVSVPADSAIVTFTLVNTNADSALAVATVKDKAKAMSDMLTVNWGVQEKDVYEDQVTVLPTANGFQASINLGLKTAQVPRVGELVASLYKNGASYVTQPVLSVENIDKYEAEALQQAMKDAKTDARKISFKNLKLIKKIISIDQSVSSSTSTVSSNADTSDQTGSEFGVQSGVIKIQKAVAVSYIMW